MRKYGTAMVWRVTTQLFDYITLSALIDGKIFGVHGGLSPAITSLTALRVIDRKQEVPSEGGMCDLLWSDPEEMVDSWGVSPRGAGYIFGKTVVDQFCHTNGLQLICRAHQLVMEGINYMFDNKIVTVWSAPNYCYRCGNLGSILKLDNKLRGSVKTFEASEKNETMSVPPSASVPDYFLGEF